MHVLGDFRASWTPPCLHACMHSLGTAQHLNAYTASTSLFRRPEPHLVADTWRAVRVHVDDNALSSWAPAGSIASMVICDYCHGTPRARSNRTAGSHQPFWTGPAPCTPLIQQSTLPLKAQHRHHKQVVQKGDLNAACP
jgi:hypothetical protein